MLEKLIEIDICAFLFLNKLGNKYFDSFWLAISNTMYSIPFFLLIIIYIYKSYGSRTWKTLLCIIFLITIADQTSVHLFKNTFERLRPCWTESIDDFRLVYKECGGYYSFISSHATNSAALGTFCYTILKNKYLKVLIILWVILISYSRIYLGVHFPLDVIFGIIWGVTVGYGFSKIHSKIILS